MGAVLLFGYGSFLNLAPLEFGQVVGLYIATLFVIWQVINYVAFRTLPSLPSVVGRRAHHRGGRHRHVLEAAIGPAGPLDIPGDGDRTKATNGLNDRAVALMPIL